MLELPKPAPSRAMLCNRRRHCNEKPNTTTRQHLPLTTTREKLRRQRRPSTDKKLKEKLFFKVNKMTHVTNTIKERYRILYKPIVFLFVWFSIFDSF